MLERNLIKMARIGLAVGLIGMGVGMLMMERGAR